MIAHTLNMLRYTVLVACSNSADAVGSIISYSFCLCTIMSDLASLTIFPALNEVLVCHYLM